MSIYIHIPDFILRFSRGGKKINVCFKPSITNNPGRSSTKSRESEGTATLPETDRLIMEECMRESMRKLALWNTRTFRPIMSHDELEPMMATMGFVGLAPAGGWKEYAFSAPSARTGCWRRFRAEPQGPPPRARLPFPQIDGLHIYTYIAFLDALCFYLDVADISDRFHVRGMPLHRVRDRNRKWRKMEEDESVFVYREGTLEQATYNFYHSKQRTNAGGNRDWSWSEDGTFIRGRGNNTPVSSIVPLKDIIAFS